jgi:hypothetical protein
VVSGLDSMKRERPTATQRLCFAHVVNLVCLFGVLCNYGVTILKIRSVHAVNKILIDPVDEGAALFPNAAVLAQ